MDPSAAAAVSPAYHFSSDPWSAAMHCGGTVPPAPPAFSCCDAYDSTRIYCRSGSNTDQLLYSSNTVGSCVFSASSLSPSSGATDIVTADIFQPQTQLHASGGGGGSPPAALNPSAACCSVDNNSLTHDPAISHHRSQIRSPPPSSSEKKSGKCSRMKRHIGSAAAGKPYRRTTSPVFPDGSVPLSAVINNVTSKYTVSSSSKQLTVVPASMQYSTSASSSSITLESSPKLPLVMKCDEQHYVEQFEDIERRLLRLHSEKAKLIRLAQDNLQLKSVTASGGGGTAQSHCSSKGEFLLSVLPTGQSEFDNGFMEEVNTLLLKIGGLYSSFESSVDKLVSLCCSAQSSTGNIRECFPYILSLLSDQSSLILNEDPLSKLVQIECQYRSDMTQSLAIMLEAVNHVMELAQSICHQGPVIEGLLFSYQEKIHSNIECIEDKLLSCSSLETQGNVRSVLAGNHAVLMAVNRIWKQHWRLATETIANITESLTGSRKQC